MHDLYLSMNGSVSTPQLPKHNNISRIDSPSIDLHGWQVRVQRQGKQHSRFFADRDFSERNEALFQAITYRDRLIAELPASASDPSKAALARNKSGVRGLWVASKGSGSLYVQVGLRDAKGKLHSRSYSLDRLGARRALWNAVVALNKIQIKLGYEVLEPNAMFQTAYPYVSERARTVAVAA